jgi:hypothetical protein
MVGASGLAGLGHVDVLLSRLDRLVAHPRLQAPRVNAQHGGVGSVCHELYENLSRPAPVLMAYFKSVTSSYGMSYYEGGAMRR